MNKTQINQNNINRRKLFNLLQREDGISKQDMVFKLSISLPTINQNLSDLSNMDLIDDSGVLGFTGGRNAIAYKIKNNSKISIGLDITRNHISAVAINLKGDVITYISKTQPFIFADSFFRTLSDIVDEIILQSGSKADQVLGVGIALPALITEDYKRIFYGTILNITGETIDSFSKYISYPCILINDANAAGSSEIWASDDIKNAFYICLSNNIGGSVLINNNIYSGETFRAGEIGHMTIVPNGRPCYCGKLGCVETYCASTILSNSTNGDLQEFFRLLVDGREKQLRLWDEYTDNLAVAVNNLSMIFDCNIILGGYVGSNMEPYIDDFRKKVLCRNSFDSSTNFVRVCKYKKEAIAAGAALPFIKEFINNL